MEKSIKIEKKSQINIRDPVIILNISLGVPRVNSGLIRMTKNQGAGDGPLLINFLTGQVQPARL